MRIVVALFRSSLLTKAALASIVLHALALSALAYVHVFSELSPQLLVVQRDPLAGEQRVIEFRLSQPAPDVPPVPDQPPVDSPVVVTPEGAQVEQHVYIDKSTAEVMEEPTTTPPNPSATLHLQTLRQLAEEHRLARTQPKQAVAQPKHESHDQPRIERTPPASRPSPAAVAQQIGVTRSAKIHNHRPPRYPDLAKRNRWGGNVLLKLSIDAEGNVSHVDVVRSSGHALLDGEAVSAVKIWVFSPALANGQPVASEEYQEIIFTP